MLTREFITAIVKHWHQFVIHFPAQCAQKDLYLHIVSRIGAELGVDPKTILATSHGRRSIDVMQLYDMSKANWDCTWTT